MSDKSKEIFMSIHDRQYAEHKRRLDVTYSQSKRIEGLESALKEIRNILLNGGCDDFGEVVFNIAEAALEHDI